MPDDGPILFFDGDCAFCSRSVRFIIARQSRSALRLVPLNPRDARRVMMLLEGQRIYRAGDAAVRVPRYLRFPWNLLAWLVVLPRPLRNWAYQQLAQRRYRWFGKTDASCQF